MNTISERVAAADAAAEIAAVPRRRINPLIPIGCVCILLFLIIATVVLALIPIYLTARNMNRANIRSSQFTLGMALQNGVLPLGAMSADNCAAIQDKLRDEATSNEMINPSVPTVVSCTVTGSTTSKRRKKKQTMQGNQVDVVVVLTAGRCISDQCSLRRAEAFIAQLLGLKPFMRRLKRSDGSQFDYTVAIVKSSTPVWASPSTTSMDQVVYAVTNQNQLVRINTLNPNIILTSLMITGLRDGDSIIHIDFRPATGQLYGTSNGQLYVINESTGMARSIGSALNSTVYGSISSMEFNPVMDVLRVTTSGLYILQLSPETGAIMNANAMGMNEMGVGAAYSNNLAGAMTSMLYLVMPSTDALTMQNPSSNGSSMPVGSGLGMDIMSTCGFDISFAGVALVCVNIKNTLFLYLVDLNTGALSQNFGQTSSMLMSIAMPTASVAYAIQSNDNSLLIINTIGSQLAFVSKSISGLASGETLVGLDMRPMTGQLYGLGMSSRLYRINMGSGVATAVGSGAAFTPALSGTAFGFDFNPTVDRIRVVSNMGQNLRLHPDTGAVVAADAALNPNSSMITAAAYTNNVANANSTMLYDVDSSADRLRMQNPPNNGTLVDVGPLGVDVDANNGFDIGSKTGAAMAAFTVNGVTSVYRIDLSTGAAMMMPGSAFPMPIRAYTLGFNV